MLLELRTRPVLNRRENFSKNLLLASRIYDEKKSKENLKQKTILIEY
jgi:hypothetical protein